MSTIANVPNADTALRLALAPDPYTLPATISTRNGPRTYLGPRLLTYDPFEARITTRPVSARIVAAEFLWMLSGLCSTTAYLSRHGITIWDQWGSPVEDGDHGPYRWLGPIYGSQWRFGGLPNDAHRIGPDQVKMALDALIRDPGSTRAFVTAWNPEDLQYMALPPCHFAWQLVTRPMPGTRGAHYVDLHVFQRSCDLLVGLPYNMAFYGLLLQWSVLALRHLAVSSRSTDTFWCGRVNHHISHAHVYDAHLADPAIASWVENHREGRFAPADNHWSIMGLSTPPLLEPATSVSDIPDPSTLLDNCTRITPATSLRIPAIA